MKYMILFLMLLGSSFADAGSCGSLVNVTVTYEASEFAVEPALFVVKQGDRVCIRLETVDDKSKNLRMEQAYFWLKAHPGKPDETLYVARKTGEFKLTCTGCDKKAILRVEDPKEFEKREKRQYEKDSLKRRNNHYYRN